MTISRRSVLRTGAALAACGALPRVTVAAASDPPWLIGFQNPPASDLTAEATIEGRIPRGLAGTLYRIGPAQHERCGVRYRHWFDGDGMVQDWRIEGGRIRHRARMVRTPKYLAEEAAGRFLYPAFGTQRDGMIAADSPNAMNAANINIVHHGGNLLALWEGGEPVAIDPADLTTRGVHTLAAETAGAPFSAHPRIDTKGTLWNFGAAQWAGKMILYRVGAGGQTVKTGLIDMPLPSMVHDFVVTARHIVAVLPPFVLEGTTGSFLDRHRYKSDQPMVALVVDKDRFDIVRRYDLPPGFIFHFGNGWEEADGTIRFDACLYGDARPILRSLGRVMEGLDTKIDRPILTVFTLHPDGRVGIEPTATAMEFPRVDPRVSGLRHSTLFGLGGESERSLRAHPLFTAIQRDDGPGAGDGYDYGPSQIAEEHLFVPRPGATSEADGWLIGTTLDIVRKNTRLHIFEARNLAAGPIAVATLPYALPLGLHGSFKAA